MRIPNASNIKVIPAVSANLAATGGSSDGFDLSGFYGGMLICSSGSNGNGGTGVSFKIFRSGTSNGTFNKIGNASPLAAGSGKTSVVNFLVNTSCVWHKVVYNNNGGGSYTPVAFLLAMKGPYEPIGTQNTNVTISADILVA